MASQYSALKIQLMATGENSGTWGNVTNDNLGIAIEEAIAESADVTFSGSNVSITLSDTNASQEARNLRLNLTGTSVAATQALTVPDIEKPYIVNNGLTDDVEVKNSTGANVTVPAGKTMWVYSTGAGVVDAMTAGENLTGLNATNVSSGTLSNARTTASSSNSASTIVARDASGNFAANIVTAVNVNSAILASCTVDGTNSVGFKNIPQSGAAKTTSYTLATGDIGKLIEVGSGGSIEVPNATFAAGDAVVIFNNTSGSITLTMSITTSFIGGTDADDDSISLATRGVCNILFISGYGLCCYRKCHMSGILLASVGNSYGSLPVNIVAPAVTGTATVGQTLSTTDGTWTGAPAPTFSYQWQRNSVDIAGATSSTYLLVEADIGNPIRCVVTATNPLGAVSANSNATANVAGTAPVNTVAPAISGTATIGSTLTTSDGTWTGTPTPTFAYQWQRVTTNISGATSSTYVVQLADAGNTIRCVVTATNVAGSASANTANTASVPLPAVGIGYLGVGFMLVKLAYQA
jgi:hypothetical protein